MVAEREARPRQRRKLRRKDKTAARAYGEPSTQTSLGGDGSTGWMPTCESDLRRLPPDGGIVDRATRTMKKRERVPYAALAPPRSW